MPPPRSNGCAALPWAGIGIFASAGTWRGRRVRSHPGFFAHLLDQRLHELADPARGSFRTFLLSSLRNFVISVRRRETAVKRGGEIVHVPLDTVDEPVAEDSPEQVFEREWALTLVTRALHVLREEAREAGRQELFGQLSGFLFESPCVDDYARVGQRMGMASNTVAVAVHRLRQRLRTLVEEQIGHTLRDVAQAPAELAVLKRWMARPVLAAKAV